MVPKSPTAVAVLAFTIETAESAAFKRKYDPQNLFQHTKNVLGMDAG